MSSSHDLLNLKASKKAHAIFILETATTLKELKPGIFVMRQSEVCICTKNILSIGLEISIS